MTLKPLYTPTLTRTPEEAAANPEPGDTWLDNDGDTLTVDTNGLYGWKGTRGISRMYTDMHKDKAYVGKIAHDALVSYDLRATYAVEMARWVLAARGVALDTTLPCVQAPVPPEPAPGQRWRTPRGQLYVIQAVESRWVYAFWDDTRISWGFPRSMIRVDTYVDALWFEDANGDEITSKEPENA